MYKYLGKGFVYGVPARDLSEREWRKLSDRQRTAAKPLYERMSKDKHEHEHSEQQEAEVVPVEGEQSPPEFELPTESQNDSTQQENI